MSSAERSAVGRALVEFSLHGAFPEEDISSTKVAVGHLTPALEALATAKSKLEADIHAINEETASDVSQWVANAKSLEDDINRTRNWATEIVRRSEAPDVSGKAIQEAEDKVDFLKQEFAYNNQLSDTLTSISRVHRLLDEVEIARDERRILQSLSLLEESWVALDSIAVSKSCRVMKLLDIRAFELKSGVHDVFDHVWNSLVQIDAHTGQITIFTSREDEQMSLADAVIGIKAYKEVEERMEVLWQGLDQALIRPRTVVEQDDVPPTILIENSTLSLSGKADKTVQSLFHDLEIALNYLSERLPEELVESLSNVMMPDLAPRIITAWLEPAVPASLRDMHEFQNIINATKNFCDRLSALKFLGFEELQEWVLNVPKVWFAKCRETALDSIRINLSQGLGDPKEIERVETQTVTQEEGRRLASKGAGPTNGDGWDAGWDDNEAVVHTQNRPPNQANDGYDGDDGADAWGWGDDDDNEINTTDAGQSTTHDSAPEEDDPAAAWGWGDEEETVGASADTTTASREPQPVSSATHELTLKETYNISSMPEPVITLILAILEDGASLVSSDGNPMAPSAADLFSLASLILAMFRAVSPYYYALDAGGNMFLYNDAIYLSEQLSQMAKNWMARDDLVPRAKSMLRLDHDVKALQDFATRAYSSEMATCRTVIRDLLGGSQTLLQHDELGSSGLQSQVDNAVSHVRTIAASWSKILAKSAWNQAVGSLVDTVASKIVTDVMDLPGIGQDDAYNIANLIARITELDDLFLPPGADKDAIPSTSEYAGSWLRLKYLSEVLQSNLQDVKFLWMESELSLYFTVDEVVDLIGLSFVDNARTREVVREIQGRPHPRSSA